MKWQPIETAPKDGTCVLLFEPCQPIGASMEVGWYDSGLGAWYSMSGCALKPTHWLPLPEPPKGEVE